MFPGNQSLSVLKFKPLIFILCFTLSAAVPDWPLQKSNTAIAQTGIASTLIGVFGANEILENVLNKLRSEAEGLLINTEISADRQVRHVANQMLTVIREIEIAFAGQLDKALEELEGDVLIVTGTLLKLSEDLQNSQDDMIAAIDGATLDIERIIGSTIFARHNFILKRVVGVSHIYTEQGEYMYEFRGSSFGSAGVKFAAFKIDGKNVIDRARISGTSQNIVKISFDASELKEFFDTSSRVSRRKIRILPVDLVIERENGEQLAHRFFSYFVPNYAGTLRVHSIGERFAWQKIDPFEFTHRSKQNHCSSDCDDQKSFPCGQYFCASSEQKCVTQRKSTPPREGDERLSSARANGNMGHHRNLRAEIRESGSCLWTSVESNTSSHDFRVSANREKYLKQGTEQLFSRSIYVEFGRVYNFTVPKGSILTNYSIDVIGATPRDEGELRQSVNNNVIQVLNKRTVSNGILYNLKIKYPDWD